MKQQIIDNPFLFPFLVSCVPLCKSTRDLHSTCSEKATVLIVYGRGSVEAR
jgi:hypothetical protein